MTKSGDQLRGLCPIHGGENKSSFSVNTEKNVFKCFSCKAQGNIIDFIVDMQDCTKYQAGIFLQKSFGLLQDNQSEKSLPVAEFSEKMEESERVQNVRVQEKKDKSADSDQQEKRVNKPLTFKLKNLDTKHSYLLGRVKAETIEYFDLGVCNKGMMTGRVIVPIHNQHGDLVAYVGRAIDEQTEQKEGKYKFPPNFQKGDVLFNLHRVIEIFKNDEPLIMVEGFFDLFRLSELGYSKVIALMGSVLTLEQERLLKMHLGVNSKIILLFDKDEAGLNCRDDVLRRLGNYCFVKAIELPNNIYQPDQLQTRIESF